MNLERSFRTLAAVAVATVAVFGATVTFHSGEVMASTDPTEIVSPSARNSSDSEWLQSETMAPKEAPKEEQQNPVENEPEPARTEEGHVDVYVHNDSDYSGYSASGGLTRFGGVNYHDGRTETYYSSAVLHHYRTSEWEPDDNGFYRDSDGYFVVAASDMSQGEVFEGSMGMCKVYDSGCDAGVTDYYVDESWN